MKLARVKKMRPEPGLDPEPIWIIDLNGNLEPTQWIPKSMQVQRSPQEPVKDHLA